MPTQPKNTNKMLINMNYFQGGEQISLKLGTSDSWYKSTALDFRSDPSQITVLPGASDTSNGSVSDLIQAMDQDLNGVRYGVGNLGHVYRISTSNVVSEIAQLSSNGSAGMYYDSITDQLYIPSQQTVSMYGQVTTGIANNPQWRPDVFGKSASNDPGCTQLYNPLDGFFDGGARNDINSLGVGVTSPSQVSNPNATNAYTVPLTLSEASGAFCFFAPDIEPFYSIAVYLTTVGTGNVTLTLHDSLDNALAAVTINHANVVVGWNEFVFTAPGVRALVQQAQTGGSATYHFHLTSTVADTVAAVITTGDLSTVNFLLFAYRLVKTTNGWHPTAYFNGLLCIGNGRYLSVYDFGNDAGPTNQQWVRHELIFKSGYEVCGLSTNNQYLVIALERRSANTSRSFQDGQLVFWDGQSQNPNFIVDIPMGAPYGLQTFNGVTYFVCAGSLFAWSGGQTVIKVRKLAYQSTDYLGTTDTTIVAPNMMAIRYNLLLIGYPSSTTNVNVNYGVYSWGSVELMYPNSLGYSYQLSNGLVNTTASAALQIGCVYNFVDTTYTPWQYTDANNVTHYGLDLLNNSSAPAPVFNFRTLIYDGGESYKKKLALRMQITFLALPSGVTLQPFYSLNRGADVLGPTAVAGDTKAVLELDNARFNEIQWGFTGTNVGATSPVTITGVTMELDPLSEEVAITAYPD